MKIGVISADVASEHRVAITPDAVKKLSKLGFEVVIESGAGQAAYYSDDVSERRREYCQKRYGGNQPI